MSNEIRDLLVELRLILNLMRSGNSIDGNVIKALQNKLEKVLK